MTSSWSLPAGPDLVLVAVLGLGLAFLLLLGLWPLGSTRLDRVAGGPVSVRRGRSGAIGSGTVSGGAGNAGAGGEGWAGTGAGRTGGGAGGPGDLDPALLLALVDAAVRSGAPVPQGLGVVGAAVGGAQGERLSRVGTLLALGSSWDEAWAPMPSDAGLRLALRGAWESGAAPGPALQVAANQARRRRRAAARTAAATLGTRLVLPLGLCFLPAFVLLGLVPVVLSLAGTLGG